MRSYRRLTVTMALSCITSEIKQRDIGQNRNFFIPHQHSMPPGGHRRNIAIRFGTEKKTRILAVLDGEKNLRRCLLLSIKYTNATDGRTVSQTHRQTLHDGTGRATHSVARPALSNTGTMTVLANSFFLTGVPL